MIRLRETTGLSPGDGERERAKTHIVILAAGFGTRLRSVSQGLPKGLVPVRFPDNARGLDLMQECFESVPHDKIILYRRDDERDAFRDVINRYGYAECRAAENTERGISKIMGEFGQEYRYIVCAQDIHCFPEDFAAFARQSSLSHAIHWGVFRDEPAMSDYDGLLVDPLTLGIIGDVSGNIGSLHTYIKGAIHSLIPEIYRRFVDERWRAEGSAGGDFYWDTLPFIRKQNERLFGTGMPPVLRAIPFRRPIFDYGTPDRLNLLRQRLSPPPHAAHAHL